jgi:hypothetical protein
VTARDRIVVLVILGAAVLAGFWFAVLGPKRDEVKAVEADLAKQEQRLAGAQSTLAAAERAKASYAADYATVARLGKAVPADDDVPSLVYQLESAADGARVDFASLRLNGTGAGASTAPSSGGSAAATQAAAATLPPGASVGSAGFPTMPFSFIFDGRFGSMISFLRNVEHFTRVDGDQVSVSGRLLSIDGIALEAGEDGFPDVKATLSATAYLLPAEGSAAEGGAAQGQSGSAASGAAPSTSTASAATTTTQGAS